MDFHLILNPVEDDLPTLITAACSYDFSDQETISSVDTPPSTPTSVTQYKPFNGFQTYTSPTCDKLAFAQAQELEITINSVGTLAAEMSKCKIDKSKPKMSKGKSGRGSPKASPKKSVSRAVRKDSPMTIVKTGRVEKKTKKVRQYHFEAYCMKGEQCLNHVPGEEEEDFRSCTLDHFGRNKSWTKKLKRWPLWCRKCYQQTAYYRNTWPIVKAELILETLQFICLDEGCLLEGSHPRTECSDHCPVRFNITLRAAELKRINALLRTYGGDLNLYIAYAEDTHAVRKLPVPEKDKDGNVIDINSRSHSRFKRESKSFVRAPIHILKEFYDLFCGKAKTRAECIEATDWALDRFETNEIDDLLRFEFVPNIPRINDEIAAEKAQRAATQNENRKANQNTPLDDDEEETEDELEHYTPPVQKTKPCANMSVKRATRSRKKTVAM